MLLGIDWGRIVSIAGISCSEGMVRRHGVVRVSLVMFCIRLGRRPFREEGFRTAAVVPVFAAVVAAAVVVAQPASLALQFITVTQNKL